MHKSPVNCLLHVIAVIVVIIALWYNNVEWILIGILIAVIGHIIQAASKKAEVKKSGFREKQLKAIKRTKKSKR